MRHTRLVTINDSDMFPPRFVVAACVLYVALVAVASWIGAGGTW